MSIPGVQHFSQTSHEQLLRNTAVKLNTGYGHSESNTKIQNTVRWMITLPVAQLGTKDVNVYFFLTKTFTPAVALLFTTGKNRWSGTRFYNTDITTSTEINF